MHHECAPHSHPDEQQTCSADYGVAVTTTTLTTHQRALRSTVAMKTVMALTGLVLVAFLLAHMVGNLKLLINDNGEEFNAYSHLLRRLFYPALPRMSFLWAFRIFLLICMVLHMWSAFKLSGRRRRNVGGQRYSVKRRMESSFAARTMIIGGMVLLVGLVFHLLQFTAQVVKINYGGASQLDPYSRVVHAFNEWWVVLLYLIFMLAVCTHISHGFYSAFTTLGANTSVKARKVLKGLSHLVSLLLLIGFMTPPVLVLCGVIGKGVM